MLVARCGKIAWVSTLGNRDVAAGDAMKPDAIFRIYAMTKPIVSVAVMQMVDPRHASRLVRQERLDRTPLEVGRITSARADVESDPDAC